MVFYSPVSAPALLLVCCAIMVSCFSYYLMWSLMLFLCSIASSYCAFCIFNSEPWFPSPGCFLFLTIICFPHLWIWITVLSCCLLVFQQSLVMFVGFSLMKWKPSLCTCFLPLMTCSRDISVAMSKTNSVVLVTNHPVGFEQIWHLQFLSSKEQWLNMPWSHSWQSFWWPKSRIDCRQCLSEKNNSSANREGCFLCTK